MSKFDQLRTLTAQEQILPKIGSKFDQLRALQQESGDSWASLIPKSIVSGATSIADLPKILEAPYNIMYGENNPSSVKAKETLQNLDPHTYNFNNKSLLDIFREKMQPHPTTPAQRIAKSAGEFAGAALVPGAGFNKGVSFLDRFKNAGKLVGTGAAIGGTSGALQEQGVNPLVADIGATVLVPQSSIFANFAKNAAAKKALALTGVGANKLNIDALKAAKELGINLPTAAATNSALVDLTDQAIGKIPFLGDKLKKKYSTTEAQTLNALEDIYNRVGPKETPEVKEQISKLYKQSRETLPESAEIIPSNTLESLADIRKNIVTPIPNEGERKLLKTVEELEGYYSPHGVKEIKAPVKSLIGSKKSLNEDIDWDKHQGVRNLLKNVKHSISKDVEQYGHKNPQWHKNFTEADKLFAKTERRKELEALLSGKAINAATDSFSYNSLSKIIHADKTDNTIKRLVDPETYKKIQKLGEVSKAMAQKMQRTPNPSGTAPTAAAIGLITGIYTAPLSTLGTIIGGAGATKLLTDQKFLDLALRLAEQPKSLLTSMALTSRVKDLTGYTPIILSKELERYKIKEKKK